MIQELMDASVLQLVAVLLEPFLLSEKKLK